MASSCPPVILNSLVIPGVLILGFLVLLPGLSSTPIINGDEARFAQASREMLNARQWSVPSFAGLPRYDKPIGLYWAVMFSYRIFGETPFAARFPSVLATIASALLLLLFSSSPGERASSFRAAVLFLITPLVFLEARSCTADALNNLWILLAMLCLQRIRRGDAGPGIRVVFWCAMSFGVLTKGPVIVLITGGTVAAMEAFRRQWKPWEVVIAGGFAGGAVLGGGPILLIPVLMVFSLQHLRGPINKVNRSDIGVFARCHWIWGIPLMIAILAPWAVAAQRESGGEFLRTALGRHVLTRSLEGLENHQGFPGLYIVTFFILAFPWAGRLGGLLSTAWKMRRQSAEVLFLLSWILGPLLVLESLKTRMVHYQLPVLPAGILLLLVLGGFERFSHTGSTRWLTLLGGGVLASLPLVPVFFFRISGMIVPAIMLCLVLLIPVLVDFFRRRGAFFLIVVATACYLTGLFGWYVPRLSEEFIGPKTAEIAHRFLSEYPEIIIYKLRDEDLLFMLPAHITIARNREELLNLIEERHGALVVCRKRDWERLEESRTGLEIILAVEGIDLGRGKRVSTVFFRTRFKKPGEGAT